MEENKVNEEAKEEGKTSTGSENILRVVPPAFVTLESPDGQHVYRADLYVVRRMLYDAEKKPSQEERFNYILDWLAEKWKVERDTLSENMAIHLNNVVMELVEEKNKEIAKGNFTNASLPTSTPEYQKTSPAGQ